MTAILVRYGEIALKGGKRDIFEQQLIENIKRTLDIDSRDIAKYRAQFVVQISDDNLDSALEKMARVCGVVWYAETVVCKNEMGDIIEAAKKVAGKLITKDHSFAIRANRSDKTLAFNSRDIGREVGAAVQRLTGARVDLGDPDVEIGVEVSIEGAYIFSRKYAGVGGLPVGVSGKALSLISGGFDSIVSSYLLAKRGAEINYLHFHVFPDKEQVLDSKVIPIVQALSQFTLSKKLFLSSYLPFEMEVLNLDRWSKRYETIIFRRLMARVGMQLAQKIEAQALVFGDCLGQVASQTMENLVAVDDAVGLPIFRPLIGMDKVEIIAALRKLGLYDLAVGDYKDCCSILTPEPVKRAYLPVLKEIEEKIGIEEIAMQMANEIETVDLGRI